MSLGGGGLTSGLSSLNSASQTAINSATNVGMMVVVAAGNSYSPVNAGRDTNNNGVWEPASEERFYFSPAYIASAITVSSLQSSFSGGNWNDYMSTFSNCGSTLHISSPVSFGVAYSPQTFFFRDIDLIAPGTSVFSTYIGGRYATFSGTSMACPHVAGACALVLQLNPTLNRDQVLSVLQTIAQPGPVGGWPQVPASGRPDPDGSGEPLLQVAVL
jgi:subtilisin family serine protease